MMNTSKEQKLLDLQSYLKYEFKNPRLLAQALTTTEYGNEHHEPHYQGLETLGDAVIKLCLTLQLYEKGTIDPEKITRQKQVIENNQFFFEIAKEHELWNYVIYRNIPDIENAPILADVFEAIAGAVFLDSDKDIEIVNTVIINKFIQNWEDVLEKSSDFNINQLLEYLQDIYRITPELDFKHEPLGLDHDRKWKAKNPRILNKYDDMDLIILPEELQSDFCQTKKDADKELAKKILLYLKDKNNSVDNF
jgi:dsRNA-specific ribonuclease